MNTLDKIKKNWDLNKTVEQNVITFGNQKKQEKKLRRNLIIFSIIVIALSILFHNPMLCWALLIGALSFTGENVFSSAETKYIVTVPLTATKFLVVYQSVTDSKGWAVVGDISAGTITYGTPVKFLDEACNSLSVATKVTSTQVLIAYSKSSDNTGYYYARIASVSGNAITMETEYKSNIITINTRSRAPFLCSITAMSSSLVVLGMKDGYFGSGVLNAISISGTVLTFGTVYQLYAGNYNEIGSFLDVEAIDSTTFVYGRQNNTFTTVYCGVCTMSGTSITRPGSDYSLGTFSYVSSTGRHIKKYGTGKFVFVASDGTNLKARIGTISGTVITYKDAVNFDTCSQTYLEVDLLETNKIIVCYRDTADSGKGKAIIGTIDGSDIVTFESEVLFKDSSVSYVRNSVLSATTIITAYTDNDNSNKGTAIIGTYSESSAFIPRTMWFN